MNGVRLIAVTNRLLCPTQDEFSQRVKQIAAGLGGQGAILLREKDLAPPEYAQLAQACRALAAPSHTPLILHSQPALARQTGLPVHLPLPLLKTLDGLPPCFGASVHSVAQAEQAQQKGASYLIAGHIFPTDCKPGLPARGLDFLAQVVRASRVPVYAIGGITPENGAAVLTAGAAGLCVMSRWMTCPELPASLNAYLALFE